MTPTGYPLSNMRYERGNTPEVTTKINTAKYREQLDAIGFASDWSREVMTCDPQYYKWTQ